MPRFYEFRFHCASSIDACLVYKMASKGDKVDVDGFHKGIQHALEKLGKPNLALKEQQYEILKPVVMMKRDVLTVLPVP